jgi:hypothetical protein
MTVASTTWLIQETATVCKNNGLPLAEIALYICGN